MSIYSDLPQVLYIEYLEDAGEDGAASCPHCGALGRYTYFFVCTDGSQRDAMKGCFSHFPKHPFAERHAQILEKQKANAKKGWSMASWDKKVMDAIEQFGRGEITEWQAKDVIRQADSDKKSWMKRKGFRR